MKKFNLVFLLFSVLFTARAMAAPTDESLLFSARLTGAAAVPSSQNSATGVAVFSLNKKRDSLAIFVNLIGSQATSAGLFLGKTGENGSLLLDLMSFLNGSQASTFLAGSVVKTNLSKLLSGEIYVEIGSSSGAIRGQISLAADLHFVADLKGLEAVPAVANSAFGLGSFGLTLDHGRVGFKIVCQNLSGSITSAKLHAGAAGQTGAELQNLSASVSGNVILGQFSPSPALLDALLKNEIYLNVTTAAHPTGELRAQLRLQKGISFEAFSEGTNMVPNVATTARAVSVYRLTPALDTFFYDVVLDEIVTNIDYAHLHIGFPGEPYDALAIDFSTSISGSRIRGFKKNPSANAVNLLLRGELTLIAHTAAHPMGEIRGQVERFAHDGYSVRLAGAAGGSGGGIVSIDREKSRVHFDWVAGGLSGPATKAEFIGKPTGGAATSLFDLTSKMTAVGSTASATGAWTTADSPAFSASALNLFEQKKVDLSLSTASNPAGELVGAVVHGFVLQPATVAARDLFFYPKVDVSIFPNPSAEGLFRLKTDGFQSKKVEIRVFDAFGKAVFSTVAAGNFFEIDLGSAAAGAYFLIVSDGEKAAARRLVKN